MLAPDRSSVWLSVIPGKYASIYDTSENDNSHPLRFVTFFCRVLAGRLLSPRFTVHCPILLLFNVFL